MLDRLLEIFTRPGDEVVGKKPGWFGFNLFCGQRGLIASKVPLRFQGGQAVNDLEA